MRPGGETSRKIVHAGVGALALLLRYLEPWQAIACAAGAVLFNRYALPAIGGGRLFRAEERRHPWSSGVVLYPISVLLLLLLFGSRFDVVATGWGVLAGGDAAAGFLGRRHGRHPIPWNHRKTIEGSAAFILAGSCAAAALLLWMGKPAPLAVGVAVASALVGAIVESLPWRLDDNLTVPLLAALAARGLLDIDAGLLRAAVPGLFLGAAWGLAANLILAWTARRLGTVDRSGMIAGILIGTIIWTFAGWRGYLVLLAFFVLASAATRLGYRRKARAGLAQEKRGARSAAHAVANCAVGLFLAVLADCTPETGMYLLAFVCAFATAAFDTVSSEIGQAYGGAPVLITTLRTVPRGTDGAVSWTGTFAGLAAAALIAVCAAAAGLIQGTDATVVMAAAFLGSTADSLLGATLERRGLMGNHAVNFSNTLVGAMAGLGLASLAGAGL